jgi:peptidoglycan/LPS O-acetylase OafA/YrhL
LTDHPQRAASAAPSATARARFPQRLFAGPSFADRMAAAGNRPAGFDYLRLLLSTLVIVSHAVGVAYGVGETFRVFGGALRPAVALILPMFFALSGFLVAGSLERCRSLISFLGLRLIRLVPALAVETFAAAIVIGAVFTTLPLQEYFTSPVFRKYFLNIVGVVQFVLPGVFLGNPWSGLVNGQLWTLPWELYCYMIIAGITAVGLLRREDRALATILIVHAVIFVIYVLIRRQQPGVTVSGPVLILCFLYGIGLYLFRKRIVWNKTLFALSLAATLLGLSVPGGDYLIAFPCAYLTAVIGLTAPRRIWLVSSGDYSYGLFLYGFPIQQAVFATFGAGGQSWWANAVISWCVAFGLAFLSWHLVEKNAMKLRPRLLAAETSLLARFPGPSAVAGWLRAHPVITALAVGLVAAAAVGAHLALRKPAENFPLLARLAVINAQIGEADPGYVFIAGDSNAEMINPTHRLCGRDVVNAGISGAKMTDMNGHWAKFAFTQKPGIVFILVGTNDLHRKRKPAQPKYLDAFERNADRLIASAAALSTKVFVAAVPPAEPWMIKYYEPAAVVALSERLKRACGRHACTFIDPFAGTRDGTEGLAKPDSTHDGIHVRSYRKALGSVEADICG